MSNTFQEKSLWATLAGLLLASGVYAVMAAAAMPAGTKDVTPPLAALFTMATVLLAMFVAVAHVVIALVDRRTQTDERDRWISLRAGRHGAHVLAFGVFAALCMPLVSDGNALMAHVLLGAWVLAQAVEIVSQLLQYRRGR